MFQELQRNQIDEQKWNEAVKRYAPQRPYLSTWYLDQLGTRWSALSDKNQDFLMPLTWHKRRGIRLLQNPLFAQQLGYFGAEASNSTYLKSFWSHLSTLSAVQDFRMHLDLPALLEAEQHGFEWQLQSNFQVHLNSDSEDRRAAYSKQIKRNLKTADKKQIRLEQDDELDGFVQMIRSFQGPKIQGLAAEDYQRIGSLCQSLHQSGKGQVWSAYSAENQVLARIFTLDFENRLYYLFGSSSPQARESGAMSALFDFVLDQASSRQYQALDFEGSSLPGLARFFQGFGAERLMYARVFRSNLVGKLLGFRTPV